MKDSEMAKAMKEIEQAFGEKEIYTNADKTEATAGSFSGQRWMKWAAAIGILLKVGGGIFWMLSFLKMLRLPGPSLSDQICGTTAASLLLVTILFDQTAASVGGEAVMQQDRLQALPGSRSVIPMPSSFGGPKRKIEIPGIERVPESPGR